MSSKRQASLDPVSATALQFLGRALAAEPKSAERILEKASQLYEGREDVSSCLRRLSTALEEADAREDGELRLEKVVDSVLAESGEDELSRYAARVLRSSLVAQAERRAPKRRTASV